MFDDFDDFIKFDNEYDDYKRIRAGGGCSNIGCSTLIMIGLIIWWLFDVFSGLIF